MSLLDFTWAIAPRIRPDLRPDTVQVSKVLAPLDSSLSVDNLRARLGEMKRRVAILEDNLESRREATDGHVSAYVASL